MTERVGISEQGSGASNAAIAGASRPRIGADRFRALADRLKKPAVAAPSPHHTISVPPVPPAAGQIVVPNSQAEPGAGALAVHVPDLAPSVETRAAPVLGTEPAPAIPDFIPASAPDQVPQPEFEPDRIFAPDPPPLPVDDTVALEPVAEAEAAETAPVETLAPEPSFAPEAAPEPAPMPVHEPEAAPEPAPEPAREPAPDFEALFKSLQVAPPEPDPAPQGILTSAAPVYESASRFGHAHVVEPLVPPAPISPLERILAAETKPVVPHIILPEILPPPPPPPPPVMVIEENGEKVTVAPPSMEVVQERMRENATERLHQLDIENVWRQVLATPSLDERAEFLREAAAQMAEAELTAGVPDLPPEHDLSRIEGAVLPETGAEESSEPAPLVTDFTENEQLETAELARSLLDMMASGSSSGLPHERALAADTLLRLLPKLAMKPLTMLSQRLAMMDNPPQLLVAKLIRDDRVEVSGPLLEDCMHITDQDLAMVVAEENPGKRRMVARRRRLSRAISDKLIATNDPSVLLTLVRNANADISHAGFNTLIEQAANHEELMAPLSTRGDLGAPHAFELFWPAPPQLRRYLLHRFLTDSETLTKILRITLSSGEEGREEGHLPSAGDVMEYLELACRGRTETAAMKLGDALRVDSTAIHRILLDRQGEALIVMLKAAGFPRANIADLLPALKRGEIPLLDGERDISELQSMFDTLSLNKARILMTYWDWAVRKSGPYAPIH